MIRWGNASRPLGMLEAGKRVNLERGH